MKECCDKITLCAWNDSARSSIAIVVRTTHLEKGEDVLFRKFLGAFGLYFACVFKIYKR